MDCIVEDQKSQEYKMYRIKNKKQEHLYLVSLQKYRINIPVLYSDFNFFINFCRLCYLATVLS